MNFNRSSFGKKKIGKLKVNYYSISYDATTFVIVFDGIKLRFDAGTHAHMDGIDSVYITHTHRDHIRDVHNSILPSQDGKVRTVYIPMGTSGLIRQYVELFLKLDKFRYYPEKASEEIEGEEEHDNEEEGEKKEYEERTEEYIRKIVNEGFKLQEVEHGMEFTTLMKKKKISVKIFKCYHGNGVPCVGYGFYEYRNKLKEEYKKLPGKRIGELRKSGEEVMEEIKVPIFLFCGDTSIEFFEKNGNEGIFEFPIIFIECTRFDSKMSEEAIKSFSHIHWNLLEKYVEEHPSITFALHHFSQRYFYGWEKEEEQRQRKKKDVIDFFKKWKNVIPLV